MAQHRPVTRVEPIRPYGGSEGKTRNSKRTIMMTDRVAELMARRSHESNGAGSGFVFERSEADKPVAYAAIDSQHDRLIRKVELNGHFRLYDLRHTALTRLAESNADAFAIQRIAGHSDIRITSRYVHPTPEHIQKAFKRLQEYNKKKRKRET